MQGDGGETASPGGWLRVFGKSLGFGPRASPGSNPSAAPPLRSNRRPAIATRCVSNCRPISSRVAYTVRVHNGLGGNAAWRRRDAARRDVAAMAPRGLQRARLLRQRRRARHAQDAHQVQQRPRPHRRHPGGAEEGQGERRRGRLLPRRRYGIKGEIAVPPRTVLRGEGMGLVVLWWGSGRFNLDGGGQEGLGRDKDRAEAARQPDPRPGVRHRGYEPLPAPGARTGITLRRRSA